MRNSSQLFESWSDCFFEWWIQISYPGTPPSYVRNQGFWDALNFYTSPDGNVYSMQEQDLGFQSKKQSVLETIKTLKRIWKTLR